MLESEADDPVDPAKKGNRGCKLDERDMDRFEQRAKGLAKPAGVGQDQLAEREAEQPEYRVPRDVQPPFEDCRIYFSAHTATVPQTTTILVVVVNRRVRPWLALLSLKVGMRTVAGPPVRKSDLI